jgi:hypothetical protein
MKLAILSLFSLSLLPACNLGPSIEETIGVTSDETAAGCYLLSASANGIFSTGSGSAKKIELPQKLDVTTLTVEQLLQIEDALCP